MRGTNEICIMIFSYANGILTVNLYKAVDQEFVDAAKLEIIDLANSEVMSGQAVTVQVQQILTPMPASLAVMIGIVLDPQVSALYFPTTQDSSGVVNALGTPS